MCIAIKDDIIAIFGGNKIENAEEFAKEVFTKKEKACLTTTISRTHSMPMPASATISIFNHT